MYDDDGNDSRVGRNSCRDRDESFGYGITNASMYQ